MVRRIVTDLASVSEESYFLLLLKVGFHGPIGKRVLEGFVTTAGAGSESLLQASRSALIHFVSTLTDEELREYSGWLLDITRDNTTNDRILIPTMEVINFLLEAGALHRLQSGPFEYVKFTRQYGIEFNKCQVE